MAFKRIDKVNENGVASTLFRAIALNAAQMAIVNDIIATYGGETTLTRKQMLEYAAAHNRKYMPYFIGKNVVSRQGNGIFDLSKFKLAASAKIKSEIKTTEPTAKPKKESKPKREAKSKREVPAPSTPLELPAPAAETETLPAVV